jgi:hypothetical protein
MSNLAILHSERAHPSPAEDYLGPARVIERGVDGVLVEIPGSERPAVLAQPALAFPYEAAAGDVVLLISKGQSHYVIGVLQGTGKAVLAIQGDIELRAVGGTLTLSGDKGMTLKAPEVEVSAGKLRMAADSIVQKFSSAYQHVRGLLSVRAGEAHTLVDGASVARSKSGVILTEETMAINGKEIHLG